MILRSAFKPPLPLLRWNSNLEDRLAPGHNRRRRLQLRAQYTLDDLLRSLSPPAAALGVVSGAAILLSSFRRRLAGGADPEAEMGGDAVVGDWILFTSPTPFNRCVLLRCPSVSFEDGGELLDGVNDRLVREERHYVNLSRGTIPTKSSGDKGLEDEVSYQRVCVGTEDGGVLSLDWPANLDLGREHGLDTTVLIVPGTTEGSMDRNVRVFVHDALNHGYFPIVMNPRGCAGSPITTARLFTAADSDDICTAINYIKKARQWTTLMSIGWGYGANMLTKYLAEAGQTTPLTAAVCIDNPFDLEEATRSFPHHVAMDQKLKSGLVNILRANKELFQGKSKGFDVARALSATSLRDFDAAVSMISYGFDVVEDFYSKSSTRELVSNVKIPLLFIQSDDGTVPLFSIPRSLITENPFTSLLLCSCMPSSTNASWRCSILWSQRLAIEWLAGVEFAFLKGRHPLLKDVDVTINPSKGVAFVQKKASESGITTKKKISASYDLAHLFLNNNEDPLFVPAQTDYVNGFLPTPNANVLQGSDAAIEKDEHNAVVNANDGKGDDNLDSEKSQVLQTAAVVINMLDVTMPSTLDDTQKKKVFSALEQGETLMKALQEAVPEDVRGKLTAAASEILRTQSTNLSFDSVRRIGWIPKLTSEVKSSVQGKLNTASDTGRSQGNDPLLEHYKMDSGSSIASQDSAYPQLRDNSAQESSVPQQNNTPNSGNSGIDSEIGGKPSQHDKHEKVSVGSDEAVAEHYVVNQTDGVPDKNSADNQMVTNDKDEKSVQQSGLKGVDFVAEQNVLDSSNGSEGGPVSSISSQLAVDKKLNESQKSEDNVNEDVSGQIAQSSTKPEEASTQQSSQKSSTINVGEALNALTGFDDSTQMAVNSVFGVLEGMIDQFEKASNQRNGADIAENADRHSAPALSDSSSIGSNESQQVKAVDDILRVVSNMGKPPKGLEDSCHGDNADSREELEGKSGDNKEDRGLSSASISKKNGIGVDQMCRESIDKVGHVPYFPMAMDVSLHTHWGSPYALYLHKYCSSHLPITKSVVSDSTTDLFWDTDSGQWKMLEQSKDHFCENEKNKYINGKSQPMHCTANISNDKEIIEPSYIILDAGELDYTNYDSKLSEAKRDILLCLISNDLLEALKVEIGRRSGIFALEETEIGLIGDLEQVVDAVAKAVVYDNEVNLDLLSETNGLGSEKLGVIEGECVIKTISSAFKDASHLGNVLPVGVIVGSTLACLRKYFQVTTLHVDGDAEPFCDKHELIQHNRRSTESEHFVNVGGQCVDSDKPSNESTDELQEHNSKNNSLMVGAVTAALGASALVAQHQKNLKDEKREFPSRPSSSKELLQERCDKLEEAVQEKSQNNLVSSLAEKAMSVAGPVVPTTSDGEVDQERLVALLAELGQKGGILRLIGKIALLWGGIRGAMSLTDRLISFLRISERPLLQRICGFVCMALVLWSPVVIPLLPTLVQSWTTKTPNVIAEYACIVGLYVAITILVMLWGKRIRGYDNPIKQYGLDLRSAPRVQDFLNGLVGGTLMVLCIHSLNVLFGYGWLAWPLSPPSSSGGAVLLLKTYGNMLVQVVRGTMTAFGIAVVEELLFRSWLPEEMAVDLGHYQAILISGLAFSLVQRSLHSTLGFFLFSLALFGIKQRAHGKLAAPIGIRTGVMTTNFFLQTGGFLRYRHDLPFWLISTHPLHPFDGAIGLGFLVMLTILYFPWWRRSSAGVTEESI